MNNWITSILTNLATQIPMFIVLIGGAVIGVVRWKRHPRASLLLVCSALFLVFLQVAVSAIYVITGVWAFDSGIETSLISWLYTAIAASDAFLAAGAHGVLIGAVLVDRTPVVRPDAG